MNLLKILYLILKLFIWVLQRIIIIDLLFLLRIISYTLIIHILFIFKHFRLLNYFLFQISTVSQVFFLTRTLSFKLINRKVFFAFLKWVVVFKNFRLWIRRWKLCSLLRYLEIRVLLDDFDTEISLVSWQPSVVQTQNSQSCIYWVFICYLTTPLFTQHFNLFYLTVKRKYLINKFRLNHQKYLHFLNLSSPKEISFCLGSNLLVNTLLFQTELLLLWLLGCLVFPISILELINFIC